VEIRIKDYTIYSDKMNLWITERRDFKNKQGEIFIKEDKVGGYSPNFETLLTSFVNNKSMGSGAIEVEEFLQDLTKIEKDLMDIAREIGKKVDRNVKK
jgi:hypothetical protein